MAKKKTGLSQTLFGSIDPYGTDVADQEESAPAGRPATLALTAIRPDPDQPRQMMPAALNRAVASGELSPAETLHRWLKQVEAGQAEESVRHAVQELRRLATSIEQHGLINPITVRQPRPGESLPPGAEYFIVTGERRYWSHVLLALEDRPIHEGNQVVRPDEIKALVASEGVSVRAHQLIENLMREDINAVEKARGLWALRYELSGVNYSSPPAEAADEVNHGSPANEEALAPWRKVEESLGMSKRYRIFVTSVLNLCPEAQKLVVSHHFSERLIRPVVQKLKDRPELQVKALRQIVSWRQEDEDSAGSSGPMTASVQNLVDQLLDRRTAGEGQETTAGTGPAARPGRSPEAERFQTRVHGALRFLNRLDEPELAGLIQDLADGDDYAGVVDDLRDLRERIDTILEAIAIQAGREKTTGQ